MWVDDLGRTVGSLRLEARCWIWKFGWNVLIAMIEPKFVEQPGRCLGNAAGKIAIGFALEIDNPVRLFKRFSGARQMDRNRLWPGRPDAKMDSALRLNFRADGEVSLNPLWRRRAGC